MFLLKYRWEFDSTPYQSVIWTCHFSPFRMLHSSANALLGSHFSRQAPHRPSLPADASLKTLLIDFGSAAMHGILLAGYFKPFGWSGFKCHYLGDGLYCYK